MYINICVYVCIYSLKKNPKKPKYCFICSKRSKIGIFRKHPDQDSLIWEINESKVSLNVSNLKQDFIFFKDNPNPAKPLKL